jgi:putative two-component system response regulator
MDSCNANVLIVDDDPAFQRMIGRLLRRYPLSLKFAGSGHEALKKVRSESPDLILLDLSMPQISGFEVAEKIKGDLKTNFIPIIIITGNNSADLLSRALGSCADDFISKTADPSEIIARVQYHLKRKRMLDQLHSDKLASQDIISLKSGQLAIALNRLKETSLEVIWRLTAASEYRDNETGEHIKRMSYYAAAIAQKMGLKNKTVETLLYAACMHDVGKIGIPDCIMLKQGKLDEKEWEIMKRHTTIGADILAGSDIGVVKMGRIIALTHHEKWDGSGYPDGLKARDIPLVGRIVAVADVFDALTSERPYKEAYSVEKSNRIIIEGKGVHFDPEVVDAFLSIQDTILEIKSRYKEKDGELPLNDEASKYFLPLRKLAN